MKYTCVHILLNFTEPSIKPLDLMALGRNTFFMLNFKDLNFPEKTLQDIPPLEFCDDILAVSECGVSAVEVNAAVNVKVESKKLTLGKDKCLKMRIKKKQKDENCCDSMELLKVHDDSMKETESLKYLGEVLVNSGSLNDNINERSNKAIGLRSKIKSIIKSLSLGSYHFQICMILRESLYLNAILVSSESWYFVSKNKLKF